MSTVNLRINTPAFIRTMDNYHPAFNGDPAFNRIFTVYRNRPIYFVIATFSAPLIQPRVLSVTGRLRACRLQTDNKFMQRMTQLAAEVSV